MFGRKSRRERPVRSWWGERSFDRGGYPGLEGDFEYERRRAEAADREYHAPYEHGEGESPVLPASALGLTHP
jgi:hypothetical protein